MISIKDDQILLIKSILKEHLQHIDNVTVIAFGSRVVDKNRPYSDLDIALKGSLINDKIVTDLRIAFEESMLPFPVDILRYSNLPEFLKKEIDVSGIPINIK